MVLPIRLGVVFSLPMLLDGYTQQKEARQQQSAWFIHGVSNRQGAT